jgi:REP element-mobilizing transposase RayT
MPRRSRIDAPGALQHIIARGINRRKIFLDDADRDNFLERLGRILSETQTDCFAWALIPNHFHLLLRTGTTPISTVMRRLLTGYAVSYNFRHRRHGHLFQNRYKSILCQQDAYLLELVRYIHLNPLRAGLVKDLRALNHHRYCGHRNIVGKSSHDWQNVDYILKLFSPNRAEAVRKYREYVRKALSQGKRPDLVGGGLVRSVGGWSALKALRRSGDYRKGDERILGGSDFVKGVLAQAKENYERKQQVQLEGLSFEDVIKRVAELLDVPTDKILAGGKQKQTVAARSLLCFWAASELSISQVELSQKLKISQPAVSMSVRRGEALASREGYQFRDSDKL